LWIDAFGRNAAPPQDSDLPNTVILSAVKPRVASGAGVFIPIGTPGIDHFARLVRTDSVVSLPLHKIREAGLPSVASVLAAIAERI
jgi:formylmethanofuran dehydrogenase subunit B